ncbi:hypothetical protein L6452_08274 [Arctium lappa]|uniref:Uncharacterized protein n=1 Tax=Arctium lappa TaxID=4217 RepID=A0ACB9DHM8_ARCLA|nr:hypothetical protein L6452_08274 [Arctium lappa]
MASPSLRWAPCPSPFVETRVLKLEGLKPGTLEGSSAAAGNWVVKKFSIDPNPVQVQVDRQHNPRPHLRLSRRNLHRRRRSEAKNDNVKKEESSGQQKWPEVSENVEKSGCNVEKGDDENNESGGDEDVEFELEKLF